MNPTKSRTQATIPITTTMGSIVADRDGTTIAKMANTDVNPHKSKTAIGRFKPNRIKRCER
jgi:hypothetical protein